MRKTMISMILAVITAVTMIGCTVQEEAPTEPASEITKEVVEVAAKPTEEAKVEEIEMVAGQEIIPAEKPKDFEIDGRYEEVVYEDVDVAALIEAAGMEEAEAAPTVIYPEITIYSFVDTGGVTQYRAYCETWDYEMNPETGEVIYADAPIADSGALYPVILEVVILDEQAAAGEVIKIMITLTDEKPIIANAEPFADNEEAAGTNPGIPANTTPTDESSSPNQPPASSGNSGGSTGNGNTGGGSSATPAPTPAPTAGPNAGKTWHEAVYEDVWVVDVPASTIRISVCNDCGAESPTSDHMYDHVINGGKGSEHTKLVDIPEQGHWEKKLVKEAGYY